MWRTEPRPLRGTAYSAAPAGYEEKAQNFVSSLVQQLGGENTALITSPTADKGSIDAIGTLVSQNSGAKVIIASLKP